MKYIKYLVLAFGALILVACGSANNSAQESQVADTTENTPSEATTADGDVIELTVAVENASNPLSFTNNSGELDGYEVDVINAINDVIEGYHLNIESVSAEATQVGLVTGKYAFIGGGLFKNEEREDLYLFPEENTGISTIEIFKRADDDSIQTLDDLVGKTVHPVTPNGGIFNLLTAYNEEHPDNQIDIQLGESGNFAQRFQALNDEVSDAVVMPSNLGANDIIEELDLNVGTADEPVQVNPTYFVLAKDQEDLKEKLDEAIAKLKEDGTLAELSEKWYGENMFAYEITE
ncbi:transporter substrate-binding domain-containing protein [Aerococcaceae bacterium WGS1372]